MALHNYLLWIGGNYLYNACPNSFIVFKVKEKRCSRIVKCQVGSRASFWVFRPFFFWTDDLSIIRFLIVHCRNVACRGIPGDIMPVYNKENFVLL